jgi:hypothetical protein
LLSVKLLTTILQELIEKLAELDDKFMELIFDVYEGDGFYYCLSPSFSSFKEARVDSVAKVLPDDIRSALRRVTITRAAVPILCGSSLKDIGITITQITLWSLF